MNVVKATILLSTWLVISIIRPFFGGNLGKMSLPLTMVPHLK